MTLFALLTAARSENVCNLFIVLSKFFRKQPHKRKVFIIFFLWAGGFRPEASWC